MALQRISIFSLMIDFTFSKYLCSSVCIDVTFPFIATDPGAAKWKYEETDGSGDGTYGVFVAVELGVC